MAPDYEDPQDKLRDNIYEVTLVVCDRADDCGEKDVRIKVKNAAEIGVLTLSPRQPEPDVPVVASLTDNDGIMTNEDGVETIGTWQWYWTNGCRRQNHTAVAGENWQPRRSPQERTEPTCLIDGATTNSYTPTTDGDVGRYLLCQGEVQGRNDGG